MGFQVQVNTVVGIPRGARFEPFSCLSALSEKLFKLSRGSWEFVAKGPVRTGCGTPDKRHRGNNESNERNIKGFVCEIAWTSYFDPRSSV